MRSYFLKIIKGGIWGLVGGVLAKICMAVSYIFMASKLGPIIFGQFSALQTNIMLLGSFAGFGLGATVVKLVSETEDEIVKISIVKKILLTAFQASLIVSFCTIVSSKYLSILFFDTDSLYRLFIYSLPLACLSAMFGLISSIYIAFEKYKTNAMSIGIQGVSVLILSTSVMGQSSESAITILTVAFVGPTAYFFYWFKKSSRKLKLIKIESRALLEICVPLTFSSMLIVPVHWLVSIILVRESGIVELGFFNAATQWKNLVIFLPMTVSPIMLSLLNKKTAGLNLSRKLLLNTTLVTGFSLGIFLIIFVAGDLIEGAYGNEYSGISSLIILYSLVTVLIAMNNTLGHYFISVNKLRLGFLLNLIWAICYILFSLELSSNGARGVVISLLISYLIHTFLQLAVILIQEKNMLKCRCS